MLPLGIFFCSELRKSAVAEYTINAVQDLMDVVQLKDPNVLITLEEMHALIRDADSIYKEEVKLRERAMKIKDFDEYEKFEVERHLQDLVHLYVDRVMERAAEQAAVEDKKRQPNQM